MGGQDDAAKVEEVGALGCHLLFDPLVASDRIEQAARRRAKRRPAMIAPRVPAQEGEPTP
jgi:hypothetical protein